MSGDRDKALRLVPALAAIEPELTLYADLLRRWQKTINLVAPSTLDDIWLRHFADAAQTQGLAPEARVWADLGAGAGFPGLVVALLLKGCEGATVHLIESDQRKCAFLRAVSRETGAPAEVHAGRIDDILPTLAPQAVTARALAPLARLFAWAAPPIAAGATGVFLKGEDWRDELTALGPAAKNLQISAQPSITNPAARVIVASSSRPRRP